MIIQRKTAVYLAKQAFRTFQTHAIKAYGLTDRGVIDGKQIYSLDVENWHICLRSNGALDSALDCTKDNDNG